MSTALLQELHQEVRRLYIAGSDLAPGDFRLKRLLPQFQQLGERAAIFKRLGEGISALLEPAEGLTSAIQLQDLALLLGSVLYTQGSTAPDGEIMEMDSYKIYLSTSFTYRKLAEVQKALSTTGSGRYEIVVAAFAEGMFHDLRLFPFAIKALEDPYVEIAEFAMDKILPSYGLPVAPHLIELFNPAGGRSETRKLRVIHKVGGEEILELVYNAAENGSDEMRITAIGLLAGDERYEEALLKWTKEKKKIIREAAYNALATHTLATSTSKGVLERLYEAFSGKDMELVAHALSGIPITELDERIVGDFAVELSKAVEVSKDDKQAKEQWLRLQNFMVALRGRQSQSLTAIYTDVLKNYSLYSSLRIGNLLDHAVAYMEKLSSEAALILLQEVEKQDSSYTPNAFRLAYRSLSAQQLYDQYGLTLMNKLKSLIGKEKGSKVRDQRVLDTIEEMVLTWTYQTSEAVWGASSGREISYSVAEMPSRQQIAADWDSRWLKWFMDKDKAELVTVFATPGEPAVVQYLLHSLEKHPEFRNHLACLVLRGLERAEAKPEVRQEALVKALEDKRNNNCYIFDRYVFEQLCQLPSSYHQRLVAVLPNYKYEGEQQLQYAIGLISQRGEV